MKIFQVIESSTNPGIKSNRTWLRNLYEPLIELGHEVVLFSADEGRLAFNQNDKKRIKAFSESLFSLFENEHKKSNFDFAFFYLMDGMFEDWVIQSIRNNGVFTCNFSCNNIHQFYLVKRISSLFDLNLYAEKNAKVLFDSIGVNSLWWPMASNPKYFHPIKTKQTIDVSFVGAAYGNRINQIHQLLINDLDVHVFGPGWTKNNNNKFFLKNIVNHGLEIFRELSFSDHEPRLKAKVHRSFEIYLNNLNHMLIKLYPQNFHKPISDQKLVELYSESKITLGILDVYENHSFAGKRLRHLHLRDFEAPMAGAAYCTEYTDELAEMYDINKEVIVCHDIFDRIEKIKYYLSNDAERERIREAGYKRALEDHTYQKRFQTLLKCIKKTI